MAGHLQHPRPGNLACPCDFLHQRVCHLPCLLPALVKSLAVAVRLGAWVAAVHTDSCPARDLNGSGRCSFIKSIIIVVVAIAAAVAYFALSAYVLPQSYLATLAAPKPRPALSSVSLSEKTITLGKAFTIRVVAANKGDHADRQIVSIAFPNATRADVAQVVKSNFRQTPLFIKPGEKIGIGYKGPQAAAPARYPAVEAFSSPWDPGESFSIDLAIKPEFAGKFVVLVKAVGLPHNGDQAHDPQSGLVDQQGEYVHAYEVDVTKA